MHFNTIIWAVPTIGISIMTGILIGSYSQIDGLPRIVSLGLGSLFLFALTIEVVKKRLHMNAISYLLKDLQVELGLENSQFPLGVADDIGVFLKSKLEYEKESPDHKDPVFEFFRRSYGRQFLTWVLVCAAISLAILAEWKFVNYLTKYYREEWSIPVAILIGIVAITAPLVYYVYKILRENKKKLPPL